MRKLYVVKNARDFERIIKEGHYVKNKSFIIYYSKNDLQYSRYGISVGKKLGNAVVRNKVKRQVRMMVQEIFDKNQKKDYIIILRNKYLKDSFAVNKRDLEYLYNKINKRMD